MTATAWSPPTERLEQVRTLMRDRVLPNESALGREDEARPADRRDRPLGDVALP